MHPLVAFLVLVAASSPVLPKNAVIVDSKQADGFAPIGNVKIFFTDGHSEMWTRRGSCQSPKVSESGQVGWLHFTHRNFRNYPMFDTLRVVWPDEHHRDFVSYDYPYIEEWGFINGEGVVVIRARGPHGPADYQEYDLKSGKLLDHAHGLFGQDLPGWARSFSD